MATAAQVAASYANAQLSTGPVTAEGKARVAQNALRHGLTAKNLVVREDEHDEFEALRYELHSQIDPQGALESIAFDELFHAAWNLRRFRRLEAEATRGALDDLKSPETAALLERIARYQGRALRAYSRALAELRTLQTDRTLKDMRVEPSLAETLPVLTDIAKMTKQTQWREIARAVNAPASVQNPYSAPLRVAPIDLHGRPAAPQES
jgi:hypothetical protein